MAVRHAPVSMEPVLLVKQQPHSLAFLSPPWSSEPLLFLETLLSQDHGDEVMAFFYVMLIPEMVQHPSPWTVPSQYNVVSSLFFQGLVLSQPFSLLPRSSLPLSSILKWHPALCYPIDRQLSDHKPPSS